MRVNSTGTISVFPCPYFVALGRRTLLKSAKIFFCGQIFAKSWAFLVSGLQK